MNVQTCKAKRLQRTDKIYVSLIVQKHAIYVQIAHLQTRVIA